MWRIQLFSKFIHYVPSKCFKWQHTKLNISNENPGHSVNVLDVTQYVPIDR